MVETKFTIGAFAIILDQDDRVLLCFRDDMNVWNLPGGRVERGELPTEAVIREVKEETGLVISVDRLTGIYGKRGQDDIVFSFTCQIIGGNLQNSTESVDLSYFDIDALPERLLGFHEQRIHDAVSQDDQPIIHWQG